MVRLKDIALRAGVSAMTVSKVLRDAPDISQATKTRIRLLSQQMGYVPDSMAQGLRTRTTKLFGLAVSSVTHPLLARTIAAIEERSHELGYELLLAQSLNLPEREEAVLRRFVARRVDGIFLAPIYRLAPSAPIYEELRRRRVLTVLLGHRAPFCSDFFNVETDDLHSSQAATQHLIGLGHRRIAFLAGPQAAPWAQERCEGYRRALREAQIEQEDLLVFNAGSTIEEGEKAARQLLHEGVNFTALQAVNDFVAMGAAKILLESGRRIPEDISLVGFDNATGSSYFPVPLTTVRQPQAQLGALAVELMLKKLRGQPGEAERLTGELIIRASTAPPK